MRSQTINNLIECLKKIPSIGQKNAERFVYHWLKSGKKEVNELRDALDLLLTNTKSCEKCWNFTDTNPCPLCADKNREQNKICIVAEPQDIEMLEKTKEYRGRYFVLRGILGTESDFDEIKNTKINNLLKNLKEDKNIEEIVLALNPDMPGETTMLYLKKEISHLRPEIKITRLARGLPLGSDLQYADEITLGNALQNRRGF
jgi:recombination protein RecR